MYKVRLVAYQQQKPLRLDIGTEVQSANINLLTVRMKKKC